MAECKHKWMVYSTSVLLYFILVRCSKCGQAGFIEEHNKNEWHKAFYAPSNPYEWKDKKRVKLARMIITGDE